jgi:hypothetical protein
MRTASVENVESVFVVDILEDVANKTAADLGININYVYGDAIDIIRDLKDKDNSITQKEMKYALIAVYMPFPERRGSLGNVSLYADVTIRRLTIATLSHQDYEPHRRYDKTFKPILYPIYERFLINFARSKYINCKDPNSIIHTKVDVIGYVQVEGVNDFVDCINLDNFQFSVNQIKFC